MDIVTLPQKDINYLNQIFNGIPYSIAKEDKSIFIVINGNKYTLMKNVIGKDKFSLSINGEIVPIYPNIIPMTLIQKLYYGQDYSYEYNILRSMLFKSKFLYESFDLSYMVVDNWAQDAYDRLELNLRYLFALLEEKFKTRNFRVTIASDNENLIFFSDGINNGTAEFDAVNIRFTFNGVIEIRQKSVPDQPYQPKQCIDDVVRQYINAQQNMMGQMRQLTPDPYGLQQMQNPMMNGYPQQPGYGANPMMNGYGQQPQMQPNPTFQGYENPLLNILCGGYQQPQNDMNGYPQQPNYGANPMLMNGYGQQPQMQPNPVFQGYENPMMNGYPQQPNYGANPMLMNGYPQQPNYGANPMLMNGYPQQTNYGANPMLMNGYGQQPQMQPNPVFKSNFFGVNNNSFNNSQINRDMPDLSDKKDSNEKTNNDPGRIVVEESKTIPGAKVMLFPDKEQGEIHVYGPKNTPEDDEMEEQVKIALAENDYIKQQAKDSFKYMQEHGLKSYQWEMDIPEELLNTAKDKESKE